jgi:serine/threonine protein kinase
MGARFEEEDEMDNPNAFAEEDLDIFPNLGKFEKKVGLSVSDKEVFVINKKIDEDSWINLDDFVSKNGGILNIPLFYHTEAPLYIIRHWAKLILQIIQKVHDVSVVLRCLSTRQLWISRDGQRIRLGNVRGAGRVNNLGFLKTCPDIYLHLDNNERTTTRDDNKSTNISPSKNLGASSRRTNNDQPRMFSNKALDSPFLAPEILFSKFSDHTSALDVWAFGMILFCLMFGRKPVSYYAIYRQWLKRTHNKDVELGNLPFTRPSGSNFIYDPFSIDFENPFDRVNMDDLAATHFKQKMTLEEIENQHHPNDGVLNFSNFMKCITDLSYSGMFTAENSKKFDFKRIVPTQNSEDKKEDESWQTDDIHNLEKRKLRKQREFEMELQKAAKESDDKNNKLSVADRAREDKRQKIIQKQLEESMPYRFAGQKGSASGVRNQFLAAMAKAEILQHKNELGLILDLIASCLDVDPKKRPTIQGLLNSPIFYLDQHERTNAIRFSQNVILYRSPMSTVCTAITTPLRQICAETLKGPMNVFEHTENILKLFARVEDAIQYTSALPIDELN